MFQGTCIKAIYNITSKSPTCNMVVCYQRWYYIDLNNVKWTRTFSSTFFNTRIYLREQISSLKGQKSEWSQMSERSQARRVTNLKGHKVEFHVNSAILLEGSKGRRVTSPKGHMSEGLKVLRIRSQKITCKFCKFTGIITSRMFTSSKAHKSKVSQIDGSPVWLNNS